jgi:hypothetical protein
MTLSPNARKVVLTVHVTTSVGWLGAVVVFLALATAALIGRDEKMVHAADLLMNLVASFVLVPLCFSSLLSGILSALGTPWGLFQHYWVLIKLVITACSTVVLLAHLAPMRLLAQATWGGSEVDLPGLRRLLVTASAAALLILLLATTLSIYKPRGLTGRRGRGV